MIETQEKGRPASGVFFPVSSALAVAVFLAVTPAGAQTIQPPYDTVYTLTNLGSVPSLPTPYGGLTFLPSDSNVLVIGGNANVVSGALYSIGVTRNALNHITGLTGTAALFSEGQFNDGGSGLRAE